jgi:genome maintenance exonuclease 1
LKEKNLTFKHNLLPELGCQQITKPDGSRVYATPDGNEYVSVTTALGVFSKKGIAKWKARVGEEVANKIGRAAAEAGTAVHEIAEQYMKNDESWKDAFPIPKSRFLKIKSFLDKNVSEVYAIEHRLYSDELKSAGTTDLICNYDNKVTILDFKTSKPIDPYRKSFFQKKKEIYLLQGAAYGNMVYERYNLKPEQIVILLAVHEDDPIEIKVDISNYEQKIKNFFKFYHEGKFNGT